VTDLGRRGTKALPAVNVAFHKRAVDLGWIAR